MKKEVVELCGNCGSEIVMEWDVEERGYEAFCPVCGKDMMLCDECCHEVTEDNPDGECIVDCKSKEGGWCKRRKQYSVDIITIPEKPNAFGWFLVHGFVNGYLTSAMFDYEPTKEQAERALIDKFKRNG